MLANWQAEDTFSRWESKTVSALREFKFSQKQKKPDIATLCDIIVFSFSGNCWNSIAFRDFLGTTKLGKSQGHSFLCHGSTVDKLFT